MRQASQASVSGSQYPAPGLYVPPGTFWHTMNPWPSPGRGPAGWGGARGPSKASTWPAIGLSGACKKAGEDMSLPLTKGCIWTELNSAQ
mmetsp:Transcript_98327/g.169448  ORF Transcript_98327/g.169448 Transcript_98327/m.169448 type:complete len:89 (+) Transcript_98327:553-819(+)